MVSIVFVHALDSGTLQKVWTSLVAPPPQPASRQLQATKSALGEPADFTPDALARDVVASCRAAGVQGPVVLVGHSMGGRIAMRLAAMDAAESASGGAPFLAACVFEDMCVSDRPGAELFDAPTDALPYAGLSAERRAALDDFARADGRRFESWEGARAALLPWYDDAERVDGWRGKRVREVPSAVCGSEAVPAEVQLHLAPGRCGARAMNRGEQNYLQNIPKT